MDNSSGEDEMESIVIKISATLFAAAIVVAYTAIGVDYCMRPERGLLWGSPWFLVAVEAIVLTTMLWMMYK